MHANKVLNAVYPVLLLLLAGLTAISIFQKDILVAAIYAACMILALLVPRLFRKTQKQEHKAKPAKHIPFWRRLWGQKKDHPELKHKERNAKKHQPKKEHKKTSWWGRLLSKHHTREEVSATKRTPETRKHTQAKKASENEGFIRRLFKTKKVLKVYQGKEEKKERIVEEKGEKRIQLVEINKPAERKGTSTRSVKTDFDRLIDLVEQKGTLSLSEAANYLNHPKDQIERWAKLLEEHGLLVIEYPTFGDVKLKAVKRNG